MQSATFNNDALTAFFPTVTGPTHLLGRRDFQFDVTRLGNLSHDTTSR